MSLKIIPEDISTIELDANYNGQYVTVNKIGLNHWSPSQPFTTNVLDKKFVRNNTDHTIVFEMHRLTDDAVLFTKNVLANSYTTLTEIPSYSLVVNMLVEIYANFKIIYGTFD